MGIQIAVLTSSGGIPVFTCSSGGGPIPFPVMGSLNGVWLFSKSNGGDLRSTANEHGSIVWKEFLDKLLVMCICAPPGPYIPECLVDNVIDMCYAAMVMMVGVDGLKNFSNAELIKRDLKMCSPVISYILASFHPGKHRLFAGVTGLTDVVLCEEAPKLQEILEGFCEKNETPYGMLTVGGKILAASSSWWSALTHAEKALFLIYALLQDNGVARDCPVYLPVKSPSVPYRFVSLTLLESTREEERVCLCLLCGTNPPLADVMRQAPVAFGHVVDLLKGIASNCASNNLNAVLPRQVSLHSTVFGLLCLNLERGKCFSFVRKEPLPFYSSVNSGDGGRRGRDDGRGDVPTAAMSRTEAEAGNRGHLAAVFCETRDMFTFQIHALQSPGQGQSFDSHTSELPCSETYQNYGHHRCYGIERWPHQLYVLFDADVPRNAMQSMSTDILEALTNPKATVSF